MKRALMFLIISIVLVSVPVYAAEESKPPNAVELLIEFSILEVGENLWNGDNQRVGDLMNRLFMNESTVGWFFLGTDNTFFGCKRVGSAVETVSSPSDMPPGEQVILDIVKDEELLGKMMILHNGSLSAYYLPEPYEFIGDIVSSQLGAVAWDVNDNLIDLLLTRIMTLNKTYDIEMIRGVAFLNDQEVIGGYDKGDGEIGITMDDIPYLTEYLKKEVRYEGTLLGYLVLYF